MTKNTEITAFAKKQPELFKSENKGTEEWRSLLQSMRSSAEEKLAQIDAEIDELQKRIHNELFIVNFAECRDLILENLKFTRNKALKSVTSFFGTASVLTTHQKTLDGSTGADFHYFVRTRDKGTLSGGYGFSIDVQDLAMALVSDVTLEQFACTLATGYGCKPETPSSEYLKQAREKLVLRIEDLHREKRGIKKCLSTMLTVENDFEVKEPEQMKKISSIPGYPPGSTLFNDGKFVLLPPDPTASRITSTGNP